MAQTLVFRPSSQLWLTFWYILCVCGRRALCVTYGGACQSILRSSRFPRLQKQSPRQSAGKFHQEKLACLPAWVS